MFNKPTFLMCRPDYYGIEYEINPWMSRSRQSDSAIARRQWNALYELLLSLGADILLEEPVKGLPDLVFTANAGLVWWETVFLSNFRYEARRGETEVDRAWFTSHGFETVSVPAERAFEGAGDALFCGETLFAGYIFRSDAGAEQWIAEQMGCRVMPLQLVDEYYYHLDTCFCPLTPELAIWYPPAFDEYAQRVIRESIPELIEVVPAEAAHFACNAVVLETHVVLNSGCPQLEADLQRRGFTPHRIDLGEFIKAGGSAKCLTLRLDGEEAALWPPAGNRRSGDCG